MDPAHLVYNLTTKYLSAAKLEYTVAKPTGSADDLQFCLTRAFLDKVDTILIDDTIHATRHADIHHLQAEEKKKVVIVTAHATPLSLPSHPNSTRGYDDVVLLSHISKLSTLF